MFPLVPYHALPELHAAVKDDMPTPYPSLLPPGAKSFPPCCRQMKDPALSRASARCPTPSRARRRRVPLSDAQARCRRLDGSLRRGAIWAAADVIRFDHGKKTFALYRDDDGQLYATDGICTHGNTHLADGLVKGDIIECPKHNGRFHLADGSPARAPVCRGLATYPLEERDGRLCTQRRPRLAAPARARQRPIASASSATATWPPSSRSSSSSRSTRRKRLRFTPGDYLQFDIPAYDAIRFRDFDIPEPYAAVWERPACLRSRRAQSRVRPQRNNYSLASNAAD